jgi:hypothetical protein
MSRRADRDKNFSDLDEMIAQINVDANGDDEQFQAFCQV